MSHSPDNAIALPPGWDHVRLLIADDDRHTTSTLRRQLQTGGYTVFVTASGAEALQLIYEHHPHVLLLGEHLLDADGRRVCRQIKADGRTGYIPVIMLVDAPDPRLDDICHADTQLFKPVDQRELAACLNFMLPVKEHIDGLIKENKQLAVASQSAELLKRDIITSVSHELRTPLVQIKAAVALLAEDIQQTGTPEQYRVADMAAQAVARLESVVENIRQLAQTHDVRMEPVNVADSASMAVRFLERSWMSHGAQERVEIHLDDDLPVVQADKRALARLLQLLLDNGLKFSDPDTPVYVLGQLTRSHRVWIGVRDFGIGIPPEEHQRIFEAFYQIDGSSTRRYGGTGTGLALAMLLATSMGTSIQLQSAPGEGSTFAVTLPVAEVDFYD